MVSEQLCLLRPWQLIPIGPAVEHGYTERWGIGITHPGGWGRPDEGTDECQPTVLSKDMRCRCWWNHRGGSDTFLKCQCVGDLMYRGGCRGCDWVAEQMWTSEHRAVCDALDHSWPTWRNLPVDPGPIPEGSSPAELRKRDAWIARLVSIGYPEGWIERGGPIRVRRQQGGTRPHTVHTGYGNYSVTGEVVGCGVLGCDGIDWCTAKIRRCVPFDIDGDD